MKKLPCKVCRKPTHEGFGWNCIVCVLSPTGKDGEWCSRECLKKHQRVAHPDFVKEAEKLQREVGLNIKKRGR